MMSSPVTSFNQYQKMCLQTRNSCAKAFDNWSRSKNLKPKKSRRGGGKTKFLFASLGSSIVGFNKLVTIIPDENRKYSFLIE